MLNKFLLLIVWLTLLFGIPLCVSKNEPALINPAIGEYLKNDYLIILEKSKSPLQAIQCGPVQSLKIKPDTAGIVFQAILGFQEGGPEYLLRQDGKIVPAGRTSKANQAVSIKILDTKRVVFGFGNNQPATYTYVGDANKYVADECIAGHYSDKNNGEYFFHSNGNAIFPGRQFTFQIGLFYPPSFQMDYYTSDYEDFAYKFFGDTLKIFTVNGGSLFEGGKILAEPWLVLRKLKL